MAYVGSVNNANSGTAGTALFAIKTALKLAGWTVISSATGTGGTTSLGTPASPGADLITTGTGTSLGSFRVANAWVRLREPGGGTREYILQNGNANSSTSAIIKYSRATGFGTGGTATVSQTTGGGDGIVFLGGGTDTSPTQVAWITSAAAGYIHATASDTPTNGVYGWWFMWYLNSDPGSTTLMGTEGVAPGSTPSADNDPSVRYTGTSATVVSTVSPGAGVWSWWEAYGLPGAVYRTGGMPCPYVFYNATASSPTWVIDYYQAFPSSVFSLDPYTGRVPMFPVMIVQSRNNTLPKGFTTETLCFGTAQNGADTFNLSTSSPKIVAGLSSIMPISIPWVPNVVPLV
jgi:hypothetical protein